MRLPFWSIRRRIKALEEYLGVFFVPGEYDEQRESNDSDMVYLRRRVDRLEKLALTKKQERENPISRYNL